MQTDIPEPRSPESREHKSSRGHWLFPCMVASRELSSLAARWRTWPEALGGANIGLLPRDKVVHSSRTPILHRFTALPLSALQAEPCRNSFSTFALLGQRSTRVSAWSANYPCRLFPPSLSLTPLEHYLEISVIDLYRYQLPLSRFTLPER
jgi:hypothetical protein